MTKKTNKKPVAVAVNQAPIKKPPVAKAKKKAAPPVVKETDTDKAYRVYREAKPLALEVAKACACLRAFAERYKEVNVSLAIEPRFKRGLFEARACLQGIESAMMKTDAYDGQVKELAETLHLHKDTVASLCPLKNAPTADHVSAREILVVYQRLEAYRDVVAEYFELSRATMKLLIDGHARALRQELELLNEIAVKEAP